ncbi:MAG TPA: hypothetical protein VGC41_20285 [Kofleriaceae bacterium]
MPKRRRQHVSHWRSYLLGALATAFLVWRFYDSRKPGSWQRVLATREGDIGLVTSTMMRIKPDSRFVALPHRKALGKLVEVRHGDRTVVVEVLDVGPWNIDDAYWDTDARPASERGRGAYRTPSNTAGIDLSDPVFAELGMKDNDIVEWRFVRRGFTVLPRL